MRLSWKGRKTLDLTYIPPSKLPKLKQIKQFLEKAHGLRVLRTVSGIQIPDGSNKRFLPPVVLTNAFLIAHEYARQRVSRGGGSGTRVHEFDLHHIGAQAAELQRRVISAQHSATSDEIHRDWRQKPHREQCVLGIQSLDATSLVGGRSRVLRCAARTDQSAHLNDTRANVRIL